MNNSYEVKKILNYFNSDSFLRSEYEQNNDFFLKKYKFNITKEYLNTILNEISKNSYILNNDFIKKEKEKNIRQNELLQIYKNEKIKNERFNGWRNRQIKRIEAQNVGAVFKIIPHVPVVYELTSGCSVGCSFCCFAPERLNKIFSYNDKNKNLWKEILEINKELIGKLAGMGSLYFATEPLDNPDYEKFAFDYLDINGWMPQLTTALHQKYPERIKKYIKKVEEYFLKRANIRFSVSSKNELENLYSLYTGEELEHIELVFLNKESPAKLSPAGRARKASYEKEKFYAPGPVACVSGFVINMPEQTVKLISTTTPSDKNPFGYILFDETRFNGAEDFYKKISAMIGKNMLDFPDIKIILSIGDEYHYSEDSSFIEFRTSHISRKFKFDYNLSRFTNLIAQGKYSVEDLKKTIADDTLWENYYIKIIELLYNNGIITAL